MCEYLRIGSGEDPYVREVAVMALSAPLPPGWEEAEDEMGNPMFKCVGACACVPVHQRVQDALHRPPAYHFCMICITE